MCIYLKDDNKIEVDASVENDKDKYEKEIKKIKKESKEKEKESIKKKYDKKSGKYIFNKLGIG